MADLANDVLWRVEGSYKTNNTAKAGLLDETRRFLLAYARTGSPTRAGEALRSGELAQRSRCGEIR